MTPAHLPPGPAAPGIVNALRFARAPLRFLAGMRERYGDIFSLSFPGFGRVVYVADPALIKTVFTGDPAQFHAGEANATVLEPAVGLNSLLTLDGEAHMRHRRLLLPPFHGRGIQRYEEIMRRACERDLATWPVGRPFALRSHTQAITLEVILQAVFGIRGEERLARSRVVVDTFARRSHPVVLWRVLRRDLGPWSPWARFVRAREELDRLVFEEIAARRAAPDREERDDVLSLLLGARHEDGSPMSDGELRDELVTVVGAGHETTATGIAWAVERLVRSPAVLSRLRESIAAGEDDYLDATVKETLRVRPVINDVARLLKAPLDIGGFRLPAGTMVLPAIAAVHFREDLYPDSETFRPERFLSGEGEAEPYAWIPFGGGVRRCIGAAFAQLEMRVVLREIVMRADLRPVGARAERVAIRNVTLAPARGARVVLERPVRPTASTAAAPAVPA